MDPDPLRVTLFVDHPQSDDSDFDEVRSWLQRWEQQVKVSEYSSGGWEHIWDLEAPFDALAELPARYFCGSEWAHYPYRPDGSVDPRWQSHFDDGKNLEFSAHKRLLRDGQ